MIDADNFFQRARTQRILYAVAAIWLVEAGMNTIYGYRRGGGGIAAIGYAGAFLAIAVMAAWLPVKMVELRAAGQKTAAMLLLPPLLLCIALSQVAGWSVMGVTMADGQARRDDKAMARTLTRAELDRANRDLAAITELATAAELERLSAEAWEAARREEARRGCAQICEQRKREAAALTDRLGQARRRDELREIIRVNSAKLAASPAVAEGAVDVEVLSAITGADGDAVRFWFTVGLVAVIGLFANLGFAMAALGGGAPVSVRPLTADLDYSWAFRELPPPPARPLLTRRDSAGHGDAPPAGQAAFYGAPASASGAPINIHFGAAPAAGAAPQAGVPPSGAQAPAPSVPLAAERPDHAQAPAASFSPAPPDRPAQRDALRAVVDGLVAFRARCLEDQDGAVTPAERVYQVYASWAGPRALSARVFETMFPIATGLEPVLVAGAPHFAGVALREPRLVTVG